jgi:hypothetical protein
MLAGSQSIDAERMETDLTVCSVCGAAADVDDVEDTNGWRWYSDGRGGLRPLCATCPPPASVVPDSGLA